MSVPETTVNRFNRAAIVDRNFVALLENWRESLRAQRDPDEALEEAGGLSGRDLIELLESQMIARHQDLASRQMRARGTGFYTIGSTGHEGNALLGRFTRPTDLAFLHYRSGAFLAERARQVPGQDFIRDTMLSFAASADDPISGGRHKVWGSVPMHVPPQTSTIASHLPKAVGAALALRRAKRLGLAATIPEDGIVVCSFGDASVNHAVAQTAFNAAGWATHQQIPVPLLFVCEDNGIGISVHTPPGWVEASMRHRPGILYFAADGLDLVAGEPVVREAIEVCRHRRRPVFLHLKVVRLLGHAGSDPETEYHTWEQIEAAEAKDPLLTSARRVLELGLMTPTDLLDFYETVRRRVQEAVAFAEAAPKLTSAAQVIEPLAPYHPDAVCAEASRLAPQEERLRVFGDESRLPERTAPKHMAALINAGLADLLIKYPEAMIFGEDVAKKGGVYYVTAGLHAKFGPARVFNTLLDETTILGMGIGAAHLGLLPIPEIQYLAYYHNAEDQIRGEACSLQFFSNAQYRNPMVMRINAWGYQKGFGGHFHNDNSIAALRDVPGLVIATPARGDDAVRMMRTCLALAKVDGRVIAFLEPIALYMTKDLHEEKDGKWQFAYPPPGEHIPLGEGRVYDEDAQDLTILTFANGLHMSLRAARTLVERHGVRARVVDLRWLSPLNETLILDQAKATGRVLVVDEGRRTGGVAEAILAVIGERLGGEVRARRLNALDTYIPLAAAANLVIPQVNDVVREALNVARG
ncbi:MAG: MFS transporter [Phycisphaerae bacterium]|nr:MAG: MFS transporter [Phycisphaerae bacterium]MBE7458869.1 MFS transporter [Planctomycetia bacterium]MCL4720068.1 MFS transporter [Phycisphaerae bacterium]MCQ3922344.1 MFS transporter [Planctomycetota bacterium]NUQ09841.1 MFS transporter [Phycisphaerae bacterium]